ncbi:MAG: hypothetical protein HXY24_11890 [Rubrivivax sp.]|nr:hypothetical protein [Rubrivivax sp.]
MRDALWLLLVLGLAGCTPQPLDLTPKKSGERTTTIGHALDRADKSVCEQYLGQLNQAVMMYRMENEANPPDLAAVIKASGLPASELANCTYTYNPATGVVSLAN